MPFTQEKKLIHNKTSDYSALDEEAGCKYQKNGIKKIVNLNDNLVILFLENNFITLVNALVRNETLFFDR